MPHDQLLPPTVRQPQFPLKTKRLIREDADIALARANIEKYPAAKVVADNIVKAASYWMDWTDAALRDGVTGAEVPRAFDLGTEGCPVHGKAIHEKNGTYPWIIDPKVPFKVKCPIGGEMYPSNDYETYYKSGFKEKKGWDTRYVDDGWGWVNPANGQRYWFVAHANHWTWYGRSPSFETAIRYLGQAYLLTGDKKYAHKAAVLLYKMAEVYPNMDYERQSRYGLMTFEKNGGRYSGGVVNAIWETGLVTDFAESYDNIWETIDSDTDLQKLYGKSGEEIRRLIEANLLEQSIDNYYNQRVRGNFGMHQTALLMLSLARQNADNKKYIDDILNATGQGTQYTGVNYALYNLVFRDGTPYESPGYNWIWVAKLAELARLLKKNDYDLYKLPKMRRLYDAVLDIVNVGKFTPSTGDSGWVYGTIVGREDTSVFQQAYRAYHDPRYAEFLAAAGAVGDAGFKTYESLFQKPLDASAAPPEGRATAPQASRLLSGWGMGILNDPADNNSLALYHGAHVSHFHFDRLNLDIFANGQPMLPDLGYPDAMNEYIAGIYTWSNNTISHNTVTVDASKQMGNIAGKVNLFADSPFARVIEADGTGSYEQCSNYRRAVTMVDTGSGQSYYVDVFDVAGGTQHDYSLHGPPGKFETIEGQWSAPAPGTLAGENVAEGQIYDDEKLGVPNYKGSYGGYRGSGFQHLKNVQNLQSGDMLVQYSHEKDPTAQLRIRVLPQEGQQIMLADARISPVKYPQLVKYVIARRHATAGAKSVDSRFVSIIEPFIGTPLIQSVQRLQINSGVALQVQRAAGRDIVIYDATTTEKTVKVGDITLTTDAQSAVVTLDATGNPQRVFFTGGRKLSYDGKTYEGSGLVQGKVIGVDAPQQLVRVQLPAGGAIPAPKALIGRVVNFQNERHQTAHTIVDAQIRDGVLELKTKDDLLVGLAHLTSIDKQILKTDTDLNLWRSYAGTVVADKAFKEYHPVREASAIQITLTDTPPSTSTLKSGDAIWLIDVAAGDTLVIPALFSWQK